MKKLNKFFAVLVALAMMAMLSVTAFAAPATTAVTDVELTKTLQINAGTTIPESSFVFEITPNTTLGNSGAPAIADQTITFAEGATTLNDKKDIDQIIEAAMTTANTPNGQYCYDIYESQAKSTQNSSGNTYTYDGTHYRVRVYKSSTGYTYTVSVVTLNDNNEEVETKNPNVTPGEEGQSTSSMPYTNTYVKSAIVDPDGGDPEDPENPSNDDAGLFVQKNVENDTAGLYSDKDFTFTLTAAAPTVNSLTGSKTGYSYEVVEVGGNGTALRTGKVAPGTATTEILKTNQRIVFTDLDVGATITVKEADYTADFDPTAKLDGVSVNTILTGTEATIDEAGTTLKVVNTAKNGTSPEGILISNLPYIALALVAIGGLVAYVVIRRRNADEA